MAARRCRGYRDVGPRRGAHRRARRRNVGAASLPPRRARRAFHRRSLRVARRRAHTRVSGVAVVAQAARGQVARAEPGCGTHLSHRRHLYGRHHHVVLARHAQAVMVHRAGPGSGGLLATHRHHDRRSSRPRRRPSGFDRAQRAPRCRGRAVSRRLRQRGAKPPGAWQRAGMQRFNRSLRKVALETGTEFDAAAWREVEAGYAELRAPAADQPPVA